MNIIKKLIKKFFPKDDPYLLIYGVHFYDRNAQINRFVWHLSPQENYQLKLEDDGVRITSIFALNRLPTRKEYKFLSDTSTDAVTYEDLPVEIRDNLVLWYDFDSPKENSLQRDKPELI